MPKKRVLPYIILGILKQNPVISGKDITQQFKNEIGEFWKASHSQVYPELQKMLNDGWIEKKKKENNAKEFDYSMTSEGEKVLNDWLDEPLELPVNNDSFSLKMFFIQDKNDPRILKMIDEEKNLLNGQLEHLKERQKLLFSDDKKIQANFGHYLILTRAISRIEGQLDWLNSIIQ
ncbi:PadR family transcriptional regulator [uncultured Lactobacillus sp.]|uniref:PadR family transcriptional regulator n=1 Tax=uncultured Lactobacillus sp. TaxID=153152 RepID=UPI0028049CA0|nr:PadR family transcriptional regulator [uncultured Lactobacillus sp.]